MASFTIRRLVKSAGRLLYGPIGKLYDEFYHYLDPIDPTGKRQPGLDSMPKNPSERNWHFSFLIATIFLIFSQFYGNVYIVYDELGYWSVEAYIRSNYSLYHEIFPQATWPLLDVLNIITTLDCLMIYMSILLIPHMVHVYVPAAGNTLRIGRNGNGCQGWESREIPSKDDVTIHFQWQNITWTMAHDSLCAY